MPLEFKMYSYIGPEPLRTSVPLLPPVSTRKSTASSSAQSPTPNGLPLPPEFANSYQLDIISALRGRKQNFLTRAAVVDGILAIECEENKLKLIDFLAAEQGAIAITLENNACKVFECTPGELLIVARREAADPERFLTKLAQLFQRTLHKIIPNAFGMLYPLQQFDSTFQIRQIILQYFRDRVLLNLLDNFHFDRKMFQRNPQLEANLRQMFMLINFDVRDESDESECFEQILDDFFGKSGKKDHPADGKTQMENDENEEGTEKEAEAEAAQSPPITRKIGMAMKPISSRGRRMQRAGAISAANSIDSNAPNDEAEGQQCPLMPSQPSPPQMAQRYRKSFSPSPKLFMAKEEAENEAKEAVAAEMVRKERSRTMPTKTVTFWDEETTVYI